MSRHLFRAGGLERGLSTLGAALAELFYPSCCWLCEGSSRRGERLCATCRARITPRALVRCAICEGALDDLGFCGDCLGAPQPYDRVVTVGRHEDALRDLVHALKLRGRWWLARPAGELLAARLRDELAVIPDVIVPVPLAWSRRLVRGYNQAELIARELALALDRPLVRRALVRRGIAPLRQALLSRRERLRNARGAFRARIRFAPGTSVLLVDDVVTTTATVTSAAAEVRAAGAATVIVAAVARAFTVDAV